MAIGKIITDNVGRSAEYHRIDGVEYDFENMQVHISIKSYANESYRAAEKAEIESIELDALRYAELIAKTKLTHEEKNELAALNIKEIDACKYKQRHIKALRLTLNIADDIRADTYERITNEINIFSDAAEV